MSPHFDTVAIIGVGLLGGSLGLAMKARGLTSRVRGAGRRQSSLDKALEVGAVDAAFLDAAEAARGAELVVVCTPAALVPPMLDEIRTA
jgi:cyclohexadieny/prephenate dehydrogenase